MTGMKRLASVLALLICYEAWACCGVGPNGMPVQFGNQQDLVIFDHKTQTEYFVRSAAFTSTAKGKAFGFIAPSPTVPLLSEVDWNAFTIVKSLKPHGPGCSAPDDAAMYTAVPAAAASVEVLQDVQVGEFNAQTLRSDDPAALARYLKENKFVASSDIQSWIKFYTDKKWLLTAFRVNQQRSDEELARFGFSPIMMEFRTEKPFFPYMVPPSNQTNSASLDLYIIGETPANQNAAEVSYLGERWQNSIPPEKLAELETALKLPSGKLTGLNQLTAYEKLPFAVDSKEDGYITFEPAWLAPLRSGAILTLAIAMLWAMTKLVLRARRS